MAENIQVILNGFSEEVAQGTTIANLIYDFKEEDSDLIVEHNGRFVYPQEYARLVLQQGDRIEFINPNFGG